MSSLITSFAGLPQIAAANATRSASTARLEDRATEREPAAIPVTDSAVVSASARFRATYGGNLDYEADDRVLRGDTTSAVKGAAAAPEARSEANPPPAIAEPALRRLGQRG